MARRMRTAIVAGVLGLAVLVPSGAALAQNGPPRDPNPPTYDDRNDRGWHDGCYDHGYYDGRGGMHDGYRDGRDGMHDGYRDGRGGMHDGW